MRITGGSHRGRILISPKDSTIRPTSDRARLAVFNMLEARSALIDAQVLDLFCGTGALGLEALSRGAATARFVDSARPSLDLAQQNAEKLGLARMCRFDLQNAGALPPRPAEAPPATLVFLDPPYRQNLIYPAVESLLRGDWLAAGALIVVETEHDATETFPAPLTEIQHKIYGEAAIWLLTCRKEAI